MTIALKHKMLCRVSRITFELIILMVFYMNVFLIYNIETSCWPIQNMEWSSVLVYPGLSNLCTTMFTCRCWYNDHNKKTSKILVFKVMRYHNELPCTLNSVAFVLSFCLLFLKFMMTLWVRSFGLMYKWPKEFKECRPFQTYQSALGFPRFSRGKPKNCRKPSADW